MKDLGFKRTIECQIRLILKNLHLNRVELNLKISKIKRNSEHCFIESEETNSPTENRFRGCSQTKEQIQKVTDGCDMISRIIKYCGNI